MLDEPVFRALTRNLGEVDIDLFASRLNNQLTKYVAWQPDPYAAHIDAFTIQWIHNKNYIFPPFSLINRILQKIALEKVNALMVVPIWPN